MNWYQLGKVAATIDGGCNNCIASFSDKLYKAFPEMDIDLYLKALNEELNWDGTGWMFFIDEDGDVEADSLPRPSLDRKDES